MAAVLIVDDDRDLASSVAGEVLRNGHRPFIAQSADEALETIRSNRIEVLVTDLRMGQHDGVDLIKEANRVSPTTRSILMSAYATARDYKNAVKVGAIDVLPKPFTPSDLSQAIQRAVDCDEGFRGTVHGLSLTDILQMFHYARRSLVVQLGGEEAEIHLRDGEIVHAQYREEQGEAALRALLNSRSGSVHTSPACPCPITISRPFSALLLDLVRQIDECDRDAREGAPAVPTGPVPTPSADADPLAEHSLPNELRAKTPTQAAVQRPLARDSAAVVAARRRAKLQARRTLHGERVAMYASIVLLGVAAVGSIVLVKMIF